MMKFNFRAALVWGVIAFALFLGAVIVAANDRDKYYAPAFVVLMALGMASAAGILSGLLFRRRTPPRYWALVTTYGLAFAVLAGGFVLFLTDAQALTVAWSTVLAMMLGQVLALAYLGSRSSGR